MDVEEATRAACIEILNEGFECFEEVHLRDSGGGHLRCDILAIPRLTELSAYPIAIECKRPSQDWHFVLWSEAIKQAADYVGTDTDDRRFPQSHRIAGSVIYPAPMQVPSSEALQESDYVRPGYENAIAGMFHLGLQFRVGRLGQQNLTNITYSAINFGGNSVWTSRVGFMQNYRRILTMTRPFGAGRRSFLTPVS